MVSVLIRHKVNDFNEWKAAFDAAFSFRKSGGERSCRLFRDENDPNDVTLIFEWEDEPKAQQYISSNELKLAMMQAGVLDNPEMRVLHEVVTMRRTAAD